MPEQQQDREFPSGAFVWVKARWEAEPVVARVISRRGSQYHVAWASLGGNLFDLCVDPDELEPAPTARQIDRALADAYRRGRKDAAAALADAPPAPAAPAAPAPPAPAAPAPPPAHVRPEEALLAMPPAMGEADQGGAGGASESVSSIPAAPPSEDAPPAKGRRKRK